MKRMNFNNLNEANMDAVRNMVYEHMKHDNSSRVVALERVYGNNSIGSKHILVVVEANSTIDQIIFT